MPTNPPSRHWLLSNVHYSIKCQHLLVLYQMHPGLEKSITVVHVVDWTPNLYNLYQLLLCIFIVVINLQNSRSPHMEKLTLWNNFLFGWRRCLTNWFLSFKQPFTLNVDTMFKWLVLMVNLVYRKLQCSMVMRKSLNWNVCSNSVHSCYGDEPC